MVSRRSFSPALCAALGMICGYFFLSHLYLSGVIGIEAILIVFLAVLVPLCVLRVVDSFPPQCSLESESSMKKRRAYRFASLYAVAFAAGLALGMGAGGNAVSRLSLGIPRERIRGISGRLLEDPRVISGGRAMALLSLEDVSGDGGLRVSAKGPLTVFFPQENSSRLKEFGRGALIFSEGSLRENAAGDFLFSAESLRVVQAAPPLDRLRTALRGSLESRFTARGNNWGGLALALLLGIRDNLDSGLAKNYRNAGCSHVLALSGMHLAVIGSLIALLFKKPLGKKASALAGACVIAIYCFLAGPLPSLNRAALMYFLGTAAVLWTLKKESLSLLSLAFIIQIIVTPRAGLSMSFILSYLALAGILIVGEAAVCAFRGIMPACLAGPVAASLGAFVFTSAAMIYFFGTLQPVGILAGLVIVPLTTVFMIGSIAWLALDCAIPALARLAFPVLDWIYRLMERIMFEAGRIPAMKADFMPVLLLSAALALAVVWGAFRLTAYKKRMPSFV